MYQLNKRADSGEDFSGKVWNVPLARFILILVNVSILAGGSLGVEGKSIHTSSVKGQSPK